MAAYIQIMREVMAAPEAMVAGFPVARTGRQGQPRPPIG